MMFPITTPQFFSQVSTWRRPDPAEYPGGGCICRSTRLKRRRRTARNGRSQDEIHRKTVGKWWFSMGFLMGLLRNGKLTVCKLETC